MYFLKVDAQTSPLKRLDYTTVQIIQSQLNLWSQFLLPIFYPFYSNVQIIRRSLYPDFTVCYFENNLEQIAN